MDGFQKIPAHGSFPISRPGGEPVGWIGRESLDGGRSLSRNGEEPAGSGGHFNAMRRDTGIKFEGTALPPPSGGGSFQ
jgi:hypothetical protein